MSEKNVSPEALTYLDSLIFCAKRMCTLDNEKALVSSYKHSKTYLTNLFIASLEDLIGKNANTTEKLSSYLNSNEPEFNLVHVLPNCTEKDNYLYDEKGNRLDNMGRINDNHYLYQPSGFLYGDFICIVFSRTVYDGTFLVTFMKDKERLLSFTSMSTEGR